MRKTRSAVVIDGSNFYHKLKDLKLSQLSNFDYAGFANFVSQKTRLKHKFFCIGRIKAKQNDQKARTMMAKQQSLITRLQKDNFNIQLGFLLLSNHKYHEKGVDVQIAVNILKGAYKNHYDVLYLVSSDSDLIPAITEAQAEKKTVIYVGFKHKPSMAMLRACKKHLLLTKKDLQPFFVSTIQAA